MAHEQKSVLEGPPVIAAFDYGTLALALREELRAEASVIQKLIGASSRSVIQIGLRLSYVRERLGRRPFKAWLLAEFRMKKATASNYMRAAFVFRDAACVDRFQPSALYVLSRKNATEAARDEALQRAHEGELITKAEAQIIVRRHCGATTVSGEVANRRIASTLRRLKTHIESLSRAGRAELAEQLTDLLALVNARPPAAADGDDLATDGQDEDG